MVQIKALLISTIVLAALASPGAAEPKWQLTSTSEYLKVYKAEIEGNDAVAVRGDGIIDAPMSKVVSILLDAKRTSEWAPRVEERKLVRVLGPRKFVEYQHIGTPFVLKDRDFVGEATIVTNAAEKSIEFIGRGIEDPLAPLTSYVRGQVLFSRFRVTPIGQKTQVIAELHADPKGSVPLWIVNLFQKGWPVEAFDGLRRQAQKRDIQAPAEFQHIVTEAAAFEK